MESRFGRNDLYTHTSSIWNDSRHRNTGTRDKRSENAYTTAERNSSTSARSNFNDLMSNTKFGSSSAESIRVPEYNNKATKDMPLISTEVLDSASQRALAFVIFVIIQSYKIYDLILLKSGLSISGIFLSNYRLNFISKYLVIDSLFLYCLPTFKIPKLRFRPWMVFLQIISFTALTVFISSEQNFPLLSFFLSIWKRYNTRDLTLKGDSVNHRKILDSAQHFKGAHTIKILPENTAYLNPFHSSFCLPMDLSGSVIEVPVRVNSSSAIETVQIEFRDLYTNEIELWNFTKTDFKPMKNNKLLEHEKNIHYFSLPLNKIGFYQLKTVADSKNIGLRIYKSHFILPHCPLASVYGQGEADRCTGDSEEVSIQVQGVPPLKLTYSKTISGEKYILEDSSLLPEYFESPLFSNSKYYSKDDISDLKWARSYPVDIILETSSKEHGDHTYTIEKVVDGLGNSIDYTTMSTEMKEKYDLIHKFHVHELPRFTLEEKLNPSSPVRRSLIVKLDSGDFEKDGPFFITLSHEDSNSNTKVFEKQFDGKYLEYAITEPGLYSLVSGKSSYCQGAVIGKSNVLVAMPIPPQLHVKSKPILDQCVGQVGLNFDLTFTGVPPFYYRTKIFKVMNGERKLYDTKKFTSQGTRNQFTYSPTSEGSYEIVFTELSNDIFTDPIPLSSSEYTFKTTMRVKPDASIIGKHDTKLCLGESTKVPIKFSGEPPFSLNYDILETSSNKRSSYSKENIEQYQVDIETVQFTVGGDYILSLVSVKDFTGCLVGLSGTDARIKVRSDVPTASFGISDSAKTIKIKEGAFAELPIKLSGEGKFTVSYQHSSKKGEVLGTHVAHFSSNYKPVLKVKKEGSYKLISVRDESCQGKILPLNNDFKVTYLEKPHFSLIEHNKISRLNEANFMKKDVCQGFEETIDLSLTGVPPFLVEYDITSPLGDTLPTFIQVATKYASLKFPNQQTGEYVIKIKNVYDSNYYKTDLERIGYTHPPISVRQKVNPLPTVQFLDKGKTYRTCSANVDQSTLLEPIKLKLIQGAAPFSISFSVYHESSSRTDHFTLDNISSENIDYRKLYEGLKLAWKPSCEYR